jgi:putative flippase GtrA
MPPRARPGGRLGREALVFASIGVVSTAAYAVLFLAFRTVTGTVIANALALVVTAIGNTAANRRFTFGVRGGGSMVRDQLGGLVALGVALAITTAFANLLAVLAPGAGRSVELVVLIAANALATVSRFVLLRSWIAGDHRRDPARATTSGNGRQGSPS